MDIHSLTHILPHAKKGSAHGQRSPLRKWFPLLIPLAIAVCVLAMVAAGFVLLALENNQALRQNQHHSLQMGTTLAGAIERLVQNQTILLESIVQDPALAHLFTAGDEIALTARAHEMMYWFPSALQIRLLRKGTAQTDEKTQPPLGYAALALLREVEAGRKPPIEVHFAANGKRNMVIVRPISDGTGNLVGHLLVQASLDTLTSLLDAVSQGGNLVVLTQATGGRDTMIYHKGDAEGTVSAVPVVRQDIRGTQWRLTYAEHPHAEDNPTTASMSGVLGVVVVIMGLVLFAVQGVFRKALEEDMATLVLVLQNRRGERWDDRFEEAHTPFFRAVFHVWEAIRQSSEGDPAHPLTSHLSLPVPSQVVAPAVSKQEVRVHPIFEQEPQEPRPPAGLIPVSESFDPAPMPVHTPSQAIPVLPLASDTPVPIATPILQPPLSAAMPPPIATPPMPDTAELVATQPVAPETKAPAPVPAPLPAPPPALVAEPTPPKVSTPSLMLLDLEEEPAAIIAPAVETPPPVQAASGSGTPLELSFVDGDLSDISATNKATVVLPTVPVASSSAALTLLDLGGQGDPVPSAPVVDAARNAPTLSSPVKETFVPIHPAKEPAKEPSKEQSAIPTHTPRTPPELFRAYDIRGVVDHALTVEGMLEIGRAIGSEAQDRGQRSLLVARDGRLSSARFASALAQGLCATGCHVIDIGQVPTPLLYFATQFLETQAGVMITAGHNPPQWNGVKVVLQGETLFGEGIQKLRKRIDTGQFRTGEGSLQTMEVASAYRTHTTVDIELQRPLRLVVDGGNGVAGALAVQIYRTLGCQVSDLFCEVDGNFPNHLPDPSQPQHLRALIGAVKAQQADLGMAFDGDGDRLVVVDGSGTIIWPDRLMMLFARDLLPQHPGATIVFDVKSSAHLAEVIKKHGGRPLMWKTGHSLIKAKMKEVDAIFAGEMSGHLFFKERWFGFDDGLYAGARLLELLSRDERSPSSVFATLPSGIHTPELRLDLPKGENERIMDAIDKTRARLSGATVTRMDGLRADFEEGWGLVRASNTTPSLVFRFEARTPQALRRIQDEFRHILLEAGPGLKLPF